MTSFRSVFNIPPNLYTSPMVVIRCYAFFRNSLETLYRFSVLNIGSFYATTTSLHFIPMPLPLVPETRCQYSQGKHSVLSNHSFRFPSRNMPSAMFFPPSLMTLYRYPSRCTSQTLTVTWRRLCLFQHSSCGRHQCPHWILFRKFAISCGYPFFPGSLVTTARKPAACIPENLSQIPQKLNVVYIGSSFRILPSECPPPLYLCYR